MSPHKDLPFRERSKRRAAERARLWGSPCPFCSMHPSGIAPFGDLFAVFCICGAHGPTVTERADAVDAWNQRPAPHPHEEG